MYSSRGRFSHFYWLMAIYLVVSFGAGGALIFMAVTETPQRPEVWLAAAGIALIGIGAAALAIVSILIKLEITSARRLSELRDISDILSEHSRRLDTIIANTDISDAAKSLVHRERELQSVRDAIRAELRREDWEAAGHLIDQLEHRFGYKREAENFRVETSDARREAIEKRLAEALRQIETHFANYELTEAQNEIERLTKALPDDPRVIDLPRRLETLRSRRKQELTAEWNDAVNRHDVDRAIDVLRELDQYMTPEEARGLETSAREIFKEKLMQLGVQFRFAVTEKRWRDALDAGAEIIREFPNARMAQEVRNKLEILRERAKHTETRAAETGAAHP